MNLSKHGSLTSATLACLLLAGCSSGSGSLNGPDGGTDPSPGATPTPSPTYAAFPLSSAASFDTINAELSYSGSTSQAVKLGVVSTEQSSNRLRMVVDGKIAASAFGVDEDGAAVRFTKEEARGQVSPVFEEFGFKRTGRLTWGESWQLDLLNNTLTGVRTSNEQLQLEHLSYAIWHRAQSTTGTKRSSIAIWGYPTIPSDLPAKETVTYSVELRGRSVAVAKDATILATLEGTAKASVNFATGRVDLSFDLSSVTEDGKRTPAGRFVAVGSYAPGRSEFTGNVEGAPWSGTIAGGFYGAAGKEMGIVFALTGTRSGSDQRIIGVILGKKASS